MPWSNQNGGGPWGGGGGGNKGPWGQGPNRPRGGGGGRGNGGPPDLEEILRRGQDHLKGIVPGGFNGGAVAIIALVLLGFFLLNAIYTVQPDERGVEMRFGKPKEEISMPGLHFHLWPLETVELVKITEQQQNIGGRSGLGDQNASGLMLTGDQNIVNVQFSVLFSVTDPRAYLFNVENPSQTLQQVAESAMREVVGRRPAQDIFRDNRQAIALDVKSTIQATMDAYAAGLSVNTVSIEDAAPPREVADAFDEVQRAEQDEDRFVEEANQYANQVLGRARGQGAQIREEAAAYKDRIVKEAQGEAQRFVSVYDAYRQAPDVTRTRLYLETMQEVLGKSKKIIIDERNGQGVLPYLPLNEINPRPAPAQGGAQ
ncbi:HflK protein [Xaviernesmea oryzae]|uniref:Protein HflK n=1 Tax=Xaviernesmea oryzae TaxID=464029 RepID=A0A1Q9B020_9HYPH|nr:FtsH protease activity modulator HflK [Xaviernesmea oryzae]OLP61332.1 HflK protein [Xaviernesmea oryzae]SEL55419.1 membrane protease subunit HflK [Xaviernesmea oryzae]